MSNDNSDGRFLTQEQREEALEKANHKCEKCGVEDGEFYQTHPGAIKLSAIYEKSALTGVLLTVLCQKCRKNHYARRRAKVNAQKRKGKKREKKASEQPSMFDDNDF